MRDRLIELLCEIKCKGEDFRNGGCALRKDERCIKIDNLDMCMIGCIADNLLANGVIVPTCKVGDMVYSIVEGIDLVLVGEVYGYVVGREHFVFRSTRKGYFALDFTEIDIGKTVFLTREEAEKALAERSEP